MLATTQPIAKYRQMSSSSQVPKYITDLATFYNASKDGLLGIAVFYQEIPEADLEQVALRYYRHFVGEEYWGRQWMEAWELLYVRPENRTGDIASEFEAANDNDRITNLLGLDPDFEEDYEMAKQYLAAAYDHPEVIDLRIYEIGDRDILYGRIIIGCRRNGETTIFVCMVD
jgi:hypothetical protein